jgi:Domain of unknown function (DUF4276)
VTPPSILPLVEGHAEVAAVPALLRRMLADLGASDVPIARPFRVKRTQIVRHGEIERAINQAIRARENPGAILVLIDADDDDPALLESDLARRGQGQTNLPVRVVAANREIESWFLGAKESLRGRRGIRDRAAAPTNPEAIRGAKERLTANMHDRTYVAVDDQPALAAEVDLDLVRGRCPSFARFWQGLEELVAGLRG